METDFEEEEEEEDVDEGEDAPKRRRAVSEMLDFVVAKGAVVMLAAMGETVELEGTGLIVGDWAPSVDLLLLMAKLVVARRLSSKGKAGLIEEQRLRSALLELLVGKGIRLTIQLATLARVLKVSFVAGSSSLEVDVATLSDFKA